jgi:hypothetical protein
VGYLTWVDDLVPTTSQLNTNIRDQVVTQCLAASPPSSPVEGQLIAVTDTNAVRVYTGSAFSALVVPAYGALTSYTPTLTQSGAVTCTVTAATYIRVGRTIIGTVKLDVTGTGTAANTVTVSLPVTARTISSEAIGSFAIRDSSASLWYAGTAVGFSTTSVAGVVNGVANPLGSSSFTAALASGDIVTVQFQYEAAADA